MIMNKQKIAFYWNSRSRTGAQQRFLALAKALNQRGIAAIVLLENRNFQALEKINDGPVPHVVGFEWPPMVRLLKKKMCWSSQSLGMRFLKQLHLFLSKQHVRRLQQEYCVGLWHISMDFRFCRYVSAPALFEVTSPDWADRILANPEMVPARMPLHAVSDGVYARLVKGLPQRWIIKAPTLFPNIDSRLLCEPDMKIKQKLIVFAHRFIVRKNGVVFAKAASRFLDEQPDWRVMIRGEGPDASVMSRIMQKHISAGRAEVGFVSDLSADLIASRIFVSIIEPDNYPSQSVIEAMAYGNTLLLSDVGMTKEKFYSHNGMLTEIEENAVYANLKVLSSDLKKLDTMGINSFCHFKHSFSQDHYIEHLLGVYHELGYA